MPPSRSKHALFILRNKPSIIRCYDFLAQYTAVYVCCWTAFTSKPKGDHVMHFFFPSNTMRKYTVCDCPFGLTRGFAEILFDLLSGKPDKTSCVDPHPFDQVLIILTARRTALGIPLFFYFLVHLMAVRLISNINGFAFFRLIGFLNATANHNRKKEEVNGVFHVCTYSMKATINNQDLCQLS